MRQPQGRVRAGLVAALIMLAGAILQAWAYWPGILHVDSSVQYGEALRGVWDDWHSPLMSWIWRQLLHLHDGPGPIFLLQTGLYWAGFSLFAIWALRQDRPITAILIALCSLFPLSLALLGSVLKDCLMAGALLCAAATLALVQRQESIPMRVAAILLLFLAAGFRSNAFLAGAPFLVLLLPDAWRSTPVRLAVVSLASAVALFMTMPLANKALNAAPSDVRLSLIIYDLGGITRNSRVDVFPPLPVADPVAANDKCYMTRFWDSYGWWKPNCGIAFVQVRDSFRDSGTNPYVHWIGAILSHPAAYAKHRIDHFNINSRFIVRWRIKQPVWNEPLTNFRNFATRPNVLLRAIDRLAFRFVQLPVGWPIWWIAVTFGLAVLAPRLRSGPIVMPLALSGFLYGSGYLVLSVAAETRYHMWTVMAGLVAAAIAAGDLRDGAPVSRRRLAIAAAPLVLVTLIGIVARLYLKPGMALAA